MKQIVKTIFYLSVAVQAGFGSFLLAQTPLNDQGETAEDGPKRQIEELIVTSSRRVGSVQTTSSSISALSGEALAERSISNIEDIGSLVPGLHISAYQGDTSIFIRGIGTPTIVAGNDSSSAVYINDVYTSRAAAIGPSFFDVERIEVLRGPQGTLYGRNATGGSVNLISKRPTDEFEAEATLGLGDYGKVKVFGAVSGTISDGVRGRLAMQHENRDGYTNVSMPNTGESFDAEDKNDVSVRGTLEFDISDNSALTLIGEYYKADDRSKVFHLASNAYGDEVDGWYSTREGSQTQAFFATLNSGLTSEVASRDIYSAVPFFNESEMKSATAILDVELETVDLKIIASRKETNPKHLNQFDLGSTFNTYYERGEDDTQSSLDFQISSKDGERFSWIVGGNYFTEENEVINNIFGDFWEPVLIQGLTDLQTFGVIPSFPIEIPSTNLCCELHLNGSQNTDAYAVYIETSYDISDTFNVKLGARYSEEERDGVQKFDLAVLPATAGGEYTRIAPNVSLFPAAVSDSRNNVSPDPFGFVVAPVNGPTTFDALTPKAVLEWQPSDTVFVYSSVQKGFKSGGYNIGSSQREPFEQEDIMAYEVGIKSKLFNNNLRVNASAFHYDYDNLQAQDSIGNQPIIRNVGEAKVDGVEVDFELLATEYLTFDGSLTYLDARYTKGELTEPLRPAPANQPFGSVVRDLSGLRLTRAPEWKLNLGAQLNFPTKNGAELMVRADYSWQDDVYFTVFNIDAGSQSAYGVARARAAYIAPDEKYTVSLFAENLTDEVYFTNQILTGTFYGAQFVGALGAPRTYGVELSWNF